MNADQNCQTTPSHLTETFTFRSPSGVRIGYDTWGSGPPLVLIHGAFSDQRSSWQHVTPLLAPHVTGIAMSRRGRGQTDATTGHDLNDEIADAVALIRQIDRPVDLLGHSYGALVALEAAAAVPSRVRKLVVYEAPWPHRFNAETMAPLVELGNLGAWQRLALTFFAKILGVPRPVLDLAQGTKEWASVVANTPASFHDLKALSRYAFDPCEYHILDMPILLQTGSESPTELYTTESLSTVLPRGIIGELPGQAHDAMTVAPALYAASVLDFLATGKETR